MSEGAAGVRWECETDKEGRRGYWRKVDRVYRAATVTLTLRRWGKGVWGMRRLTLWVVGNMMSSGEIQVSAGTRQRRVYLRKRFQISESSLAAKQSRTTRGHDGLG